MERRARNLILKTLIVTPSGALSPGLLSISAVAVGSTMGFMGGLMVAVGHTMFEAPYVFALTKLFGRLGRVIRRYDKILNSVTVLFAFYFAYGLMFTGMDEGSINVSEAVLAGAIFTGANAYFLLWWLSVGLPLLEEAAVLGNRGFLIMYLSHVWMDYLWLGLLAAMGGVSRLLGPIYPLFMKSLALLLIMFAVDLTLRTYFDKKILPW